MDPVNNRRIMELGKIRVLFLISLLVAVAGIREAAGAASPWWTSEHGRVRLIAASDSVGTADRVRLGLQFRMKPGWKIYWRSPGDAGFPPKPNWAGSENLAEARIEWPVPERFEVLGLQTLGYKDEVVLPVTAELFQPGRPVRLKTTISFLTCSEVCVPYNANVALTLPAGPETSTPEQGLIQRFAGRVPQRQPLDGLSLGRVYVTGAPGDQSLMVDAVSDRPMGSADLFVEGPVGVSFGPPTLRRGVGGRQALLRIAAVTTRGKPVDLTGQELTFTLADDNGRAIERRARVVPAPASAIDLARSVGSQESPLRFALMLLFALAGGLILNLMPCVLPVLSIKLLSVVGHGGGHPTGVRRGFLASAAGILASFLVLGTVAVGLKSAGLAAGWGIQFQQPLFLVAMVAILVLFSANMWGLFEFRLPGRLGERLAGAGSGHGMGGHFLTGAFATLLATPCSAPFLGTAVGFALSRTAVEIYAVFAALGIGLALPYLSVAVAPSLVTRLPKPGPWMITLRRILGIALVATALWLLTVLASQSGGMAAGLVGVMMAAVLVALWQLHGVSPRARRVSWGIVGVLVVFSLVSVRNFATATDGGAAEAVEDAGPWKTFDRDMIAGETRLGRVVFVDVTADWCITCQVNKTLVLRRGEVAKRLRDNNVTAMKADWTRPDKRISDFLAHFGRYGIPFNVVYGPGAPAGIPLPEILTESVVLEALDRAAGPGPTVKR